MTLLEAMQGWQNFYFMIGGAAAGLIGLMFVAISMGTRLVTRERATDIQIFVSPTLFHFMMVLVIACLMLVPYHHIVSFSALLFGIGVVGLRRVSEVIFRTKRRESDDPIESGHRLWHMVLPMFAYAIGCLVAIGAIISGLAWLLNGIAIMVVLLVICALHNTWTLILWIAHRHEG